MKLTRICVGLAVWIFIMGPFLMLGKLSLDIRGCDLLGRFKNVDMELPLPSELFWRFGPVGWWAYLTPIALALAVAASLRKPLPRLWFAGLLAVSCLQFVSGFGAVLIYYKMTSVMGVPCYPIPIPKENLAANIALLGTSIGLAAWSVARMRKSDRSLIFPPATGRRGS